MWMRMLAVVAGIILAAQPADALWLNLSPNQLAEAVAYGRAARDVPSELFEREWRVRAEGGHGSATVDSEFLVVARVARELARRGNPESLNLPEAMCAFLGGPALYIAVTLEVASREETAAVEARLEAGGRLMAPLEVWPYQLVVREADPGATSTTRVSHYLKFAVDGIDPLGKVTVVTSNPEGRTWRFSLDLGAMR